MLQIYRVKIVEMTSLLFLFIAVVILAAFCNGKKQPAKSYVTRAYFRPCIYHHPKHDDSVYLPSL